MEKNELLVLAKMENVDDIKSYEIFDVSNQVEMCASVFESMAYEKKVKIITNKQYSITNRKLWKVNSRRSKR